MKKCLLVTLCLLLSAVAYAAPLSSARQPSPETVAELEVAHRRAEDLIATNDFRGALRAYSDIILMEPDDETAYVNMGTCYLLLGEYKNAEDAYNNALAIDPENEAALTGLRRIHDPDSARLDEDQERSVAAAVAAPPQWMLRDPAAPADIKPSPTASPSPAPAPNAAPPAPPQRRPALLSQGALPSAISLTNSERLQKALKNAGLYDGPIDGVIGPESRRAVQAFQAQNGLSVDGKAGPKTWAVLKRYLTD